MEKLKFNISDLRDLEIQANNFKNIDVEYVFYYDETNNIRKFWLKSANKFNIPIESLSKNFVLGGLLHLKQRTNFNTDILKDSLRLPSNIKEIKFKHIAKGDFLSCLKSRKLETFLNWLLHNDLFVHYSNLNILYWSSIDILESMIPKELLPIHMELKTILYELIEIDLENFISIMYRYDYPSIDKEKANDFLDDLLNFIEQNKTKLMSKYPNINKEIINLVCQVIKGSKNTELTFITDEKNHVLIDNLFIFYKRPFGLFRSSKHIFDEESSIEDIFDKWEFYDGEQKWEGFEFQNSETNDLIQMSDIIVGLLGKLFEYINDADFSELNKIEDSLEKQQLDNLTKIVKLIDKSDKQSTAFIHSIQSLVERDKLTLLLTKFARM